MYAIRSYYASNTTTSLGECVTDASGATSSGETGATLAAQPTVRITSYNVCYTKLLRVGRLLHLPQMRIKAKAESCIDCKKCNSKCPMSIDVNAAVKTGSVKSYDCILCGECVDVCPKDVLSYRKKA